jgi:hypothetical protein
MKLKHILSLVVMFFSSLMMSAQEGMSVKSFDEMPNDLDARVNFSKIDQNGKKCALVKIVTTEGDFTFDNGYLGIEQFVNNGFDSSQVILNHYQPRPHIDLPQACRQALIEIGIRDENIQLPTHCSRCNPQKFFSARRLGINSGRTLTVAMQ